MQPLSVVPCLNLHKTSPVEITLIVWCFYRNVQMWWGEVVNLVCPQLQKVRRGCAVLCRCYIPYGLCWEFLHKVLLSWTRHMWWLVGLTPDKPTGIWGSLCFGRASQMLAYSAPTPGWKVLASAIAVACRWWSCVQENILFHFCCLTVHVQPSSDCVV